MGRLRVSGLARLVSISSKLPTKQTDFKMLIPTTDGSGRSIFYMQLVNCSALKIFNIGIIITTMSCVVAVAPCSAVDIWRSMRLFCSAALICCCDGVFAGVSAAVRSGDFSTCFAPTDDSWSC